MILASGASTPQLKWLSTRSRSLAICQVLQIGTGIIGQVALLARWSPHSQTDLFLLFSGIPWLVSAALLLGGLEMAVPAAYHRAAAGGDESLVRRFVGQAGVFTLAIGLVAALSSGLAIGWWASRSGLEQPLSTWMGLALGAQVVPASLGGLWRGLLVAQDRLIRMRLVLLMGSLATAAGYAWLPGPPALALPLATVVSVLVSAGMAWWFCEEDRALFSAPRLWPLEPAMRNLIGTLGALSIGAGVVHLQTLVERSAALSLGTGIVTAASIAARGWDAVMAAIVAASISAAYPQWARSHAQGDRQLGRQLLRWSLGRAIPMSLGAATLIGMLIWIARPYLEHPLQWAAAGQAAWLVLALLPRFVLLCSVQPLVLKYYAQGTPWPPIMGAIIGLGVCAAGMLALVPLWGLAGYAVTEAASVLPGLIYLSWREWRAAG